MSQGFILLFLLRILELSLKLFRISEDVSFSASLLCFIIRYCFMALVSQSWYVSRWESAVVVYSMFEYIYNDKRLLMNTRWKLMTLSFTLILNKMLKRRYMNRFSFLAREYLCHSHTYMHANTHNIHRYIYICVCVCVRVCIIYLKRVLNICGRAYISKLG